MASRRPRLASVVPADAGTPKVRVALYRRASTDEANQPYSLDAQDQRLRPYVAAHPGWEVVADYVERASGKDVEGRPQLKQLLADAAGGKFDLVLVARIDRWSRCLGDLIHSVEYLSGAGVAFHSSSEHFDTTTPMGKLTLQMLGMFAEFERSLIIDRIVRGNAAKIAKGLPLTTRVGYGLTVDEDGRVTSDPATIGVVRRILGEYVHDQHGTKAIAHRLNHDEVPGPGTRPWSQDSVSRVLRNRSFVGELWHRDRWNTGAHAPVVDAELFEQAQVIADGRTDNQAAARRRGEFVLTGTVRCGRCEGAYVGTSGTGRSGTAHRYYSCQTSRRYGKTGCDAPSLPADELELLVTESLLGLYSDSTLFGQAIEAHVAAHAERRDPISEQLHAATTALTAKQRVRAKYQDDYEADRLSAERYETRAAELDQEIVGMSAHIAELELSLDVAELPTLPAPDELAALHTGLGEGVRSGSIQVRKALFTALVERIEVHDADDIRPTFRLYDPAATSLLDDSSSSEVPGQGPSRPGSGSRFSSRSPGWS